TKSRFLIRRRENHSEPVSFALTNLQPPTSDPGLFYVLQLILSSEKNIDAAFFSKILTLVLIAAALSV
ncbi:MAG: hypothetical protein PHO82_10945, partial [Mesotoga sp.]|uniref:hypothetical protein n=1 Tax=Mesotoga sp. TaxID=2053577 RepID=UPI00261FFB2A